MNELRIAVAACTLMLAGCATTKFTSDYDRAHDFGAYKTFAWAGESPMTVLGKTRVPPMLETRLAREVRAELEAKGYRFVETLEQADFGVSFTVGSRSSTEVIKSPETFWVNQTNWRWGRAYYPAYPAAYRRPVAVGAVTPVTVTTTEVQAYTEGTLAIDIYDVKTKAPVWHGAGTKTVNTSEVAGRRGSIDSGKIRAGVAKVLKGFPPE
ncbi:MAG: DUF4136 domain-containing protein [Erythrobacter sp.]|uniref:DUF4136 domain-containing protein n=1 Tax=Erythrobacter sp. TaxID=1042 RepID=UPI0025EE8CFB|nr:DUF4136 domain-containing protein [Erythrobacter sp.]MCL9998618.1 DUF4136 domain-containing protein [Erythrobacter sp.]